MNELKPRSHGLSHFFAGLPCCSICSLCGSHLIFAKENDTASFNCCSYEPLEIIETILYCPNYDSHKKPIL